MNDPAWANPAPPPALLHATAILQRHRTLRLHGDVTLSQWRVPPGPIRIAAADTHRVLLWTGAVAVRPGAVASTQRQTRVGNDMDLLPAGVPLACETRAPSNLFVVALPDAAFRHCVSEPDGAATVLPFLLAGDARLAHAGWALQAELEFGDVDDSAYAQQLVVALAMHWWRRSRNPAEAVQAGRAPRTPLEIRRALAHIESRLCSNLQVQELAGVAGLSVSHFTTLFRRATGKSVHHYVVQKRVEKARDLLLRGSASVCDVALEAGFSHQSHLARWMRRLLGVTPKRLRLESQQMVGSDC